MTCKTQNTAILAIEQMELNEKGEANSIIGKIETGMDQPYQGKLIFS